MSGLGNDQEVSPEAVLAYGRSVLAAQPFSVLIGAELHALAPGHAELQLPLGAQLKQQHGFAHGGIVSYMADNALTFAGDEVFFGESGSLAMVPCASAQSFSVPSSATATTSQVHTACELPVWTARARAISRWPMAGRT